MNSKILRTLEISAHIISAGVSILVMLRAAEWRVDFTGLLFIVWAVSPYLFAYSLGVLIRRFTRFPMTKLIFCVTAILMLALTLFAYLGTLGDDSSTYALIFLAVPVYLYIGGIIVIAVGILTAALFGKRKTENLQ